MLPRTVGWLGPSHSIEMESVIDNAPLSRLLSCLYNIRSHFVCITFALLTGLRSSGRRLPILLLAALLVFGYTARCVWRNPDWSSRERLNLSGLETNPRCSKCHYNLGNVYKDSGDLSRAKYHYTEAIKLWPIHGSSLNNLGTILENEGNLTGAEQVPFKDSP